ncbi:D-alanyl-D-alanine carboxypeptidase/D-alanyl-D-alanine-endopeptidase [Robiginitalea biformata]|uniref:D-alanyl-D-alanine carboxypeptidase/D-alanyl-D-alanine-endopeptidase n=1 Tax=Robiginitalea biformata TaxID=252307 RepID=UPI003B5CFC2E
MPGYLLRFAIPYSVLGALAILVFLSGCSPVRKVNRHLNNQFQNEARSNQFTGILLVDATSRDTLFSLNAEKYFTPASNVKLFTLYAALKTLPDRIPALKYARHRDSVYVVGTGDPSALHPDLMDSTALKFIRGFPHVTMVNSNLTDPAWGPGWSWDDFDAYYMPGRSAFPVHGNILRLIGYPDSLHVSPSIFRDSLSPRRGGRARSQLRNVFLRTPSPGDTLDIPLRISGQLERDLWAAFSGRVIVRGDTLPPTPLETLPGMASDSLYAKMMKESDNFIAEQLMLLVSGTQSDTLSFEAARDRVLEEFLPEIPQVPRWVDGSGLSRYNLFTPESAVFLLDKLYREFPEPRLFALLAQGGQDGTLAEWYRDSASPYVFGKTGSLSNNHNLSGYLVTLSGKRVCFSMMNNHFTQPSDVIKENMQELLQWVRENY